MNILEQAKNEEFVKEQFIKGRILDDTKDYGRTQFVDEIYKLQQENQQLQEELKYTIGIVEHNRIISEKNKEIHQLKGIIKENTILVKDEYGDYQKCNINPLRMKQKYEKQVDNWNKLKEIARSQSGFKKIAGLKGGVWFEIDELLDKMQELEGSDSNE